MFNNFKVVCLWRKCLIQNIWIIHWKCSRIYQNVRFKLIIGTLDKLKSKSCLKKHQYSQCCTDLGVADLGSLTSLSSPSVSCSSLLVSCRSLLSFIVLFSFIVENGGFRTLNSGVRESGGTRIISKSCPRFIEFNCFYVWTFGLWREVVEFTKCRKVLIFPR